MNGMNGMGAPLLSSLSVRKRAEWGRLLHIYIYERVALALARASFKFLGTLLLACGRLLSALLSAC